MGTAESHLLTDDEYLAYLRDGYVVVQPQLDPATHDLLYRRADALYREVGKEPAPGWHLEIAGDNLRARIPEVERLLDDAAVRGALTSILGGAYLLHPHHFVHRAQSADQGFHQDGNLPWNERGHYRAHRPDWAMLFYYPQAVDAGNGPTEVVPGSQYWTRDFERADGSWHADDSLDREWRARRARGADDAAARDARLQRMLDALGIPDLERRTVHLPRGAVVVAHYDLIHRGTRRLPGAAPRYMFKFYVARTRKPVAPAWRSAGAEPDLSGIRAELRPVVRAVWRWSAGRPVGQRAPAPGAAEALRHPAEHERIRAAYELGAAAAAGEPVALELAAALDDEREAVRRAAGYGLGLAGAAARAALLDAAASPRAGTRRLAAFALGSSYEPLGPRAIESLLGLLADPDDLVRSNAAYGLGMRMREPDAPVSRIVDALLDRLDAGLEPDNTGSGGFGRSTVREEIAAALVQAAANHQLDARRCERIAELGLGACDRYVNGLTVEALARQRHAPAARLVSFLAGRAFHPARLLEAGA